jgi:phosphoribosylformimino-5-aminoimidazole carboxamide ribotide isomerase
MIIIPTIDIQNGRCVRLTQGDFGRCTVYDTDPLAVAKQFEKDGAMRIALCDLDRARNGDSTNSDLLNEIRRIISTPLQLAGGIRTSNDIGEIIDLGFDRIVISANTALRLISTTTPLSARAWSTRVIVSLDAVGDFLVANAWATQTSINLYDACRRCLTSGISSYIYTDVARDGTLGGPSYEIAEKLRNMISGELSVAGGIGSLSDIEKLKKIGIDGAIIGKALYEYKFTQKEAQGLC